MLAEKLEPELNPVHVGREGWLFLTEGSNSVSQLYTNPSSFTQEMAEQWVELLNNRERKLAELGCAYCHLPAPEKLTVLHQYYDGELENLAGSPIIQLAEKYSHAIPSFLNPLNYFASQIQDYLLYWKTDTHWSFWGCYSAYQLLCAHLGFASNTQIVEYPYSEGPVMFDLASKLSNPYSEYGRFYQLDKNAIRINANELVRYKEENNLVNELSLHVGSNVVFQNNSETAIDKTLILFGDSFAEYRSHLLTGMLAETFREVHFVWNSCLDYEYIERAKPDIVVSELAERFMTRVPVDDLNLSKFVAKRLADYLESKAE